MIEQVMTKYRTIKLKNIYDSLTIDSEFQKILPSGILCSYNRDFLVFDFDVVDLRYLESLPPTPIVALLLEQLHKIKSFSTANGKIVYSSFNKEKKVINRTAKRRQRLAYEYYKKDFPTIDNECPSSVVNQIYCEDSFKFLKTLPDNCVDIIVTSPPYNFGISYNSTEDANPWRDYFNKLFSIFKECIRVLKNQGRIIINVQPMYSDYIPTHHIISNFFLESGLIWKGEILWEKNNYNCKYCTWGSWQSPAAPYLKYSWEFIEVFCKNSLKKEGNKKNIDISAEEFKKFVYAKWSIAPERNMKQYKHDAMFPESLVERCLKLFSYQNDIVLDPFNGAGTTTAVAYKLGRRFIGIDIDPDYCKTARARLEKSKNLFSVQGSHDH